MLAALILFSPITAFLPSIASPTATTSLATHEINLTYTSQVFTTYFGSTLGTTVGKAPLNFPSRGIGFVALKGECSEYSLPVTVSRGTQLNVRMTASQPANFYLLPSYMFATSLNGCIVTTASLLVSENFTAFTLHWTAPQQGTFYFVFTGPTAVIILVNDGSVDPTEQAANLTYAKSTETSFSVYTSTSTTSYTTTSAAPPFALQPGARDDLPILALAAILAILASVLLLYARKKVSNRPRTI
jgi:hypothetical protein